MNINNLVNSLNAREVSSIFEINEWDLLFSCYNLSLKVSFRSKSTPPVIFFCQDCAFHSPMRFYLNVIGYFTRSVIPVYRYPKASISRPDTLGKWTRVCFSASRQSSSALGTVRFYTLGKPRDNSFISRSREWTRDFETLDMEWVMARRGLNALSKREVPKR